MFRLFSHLQTQSLCYLVSSKTFYFYRDRAPQGNLLWHFQPQAMTRLLGNSASWWECLRKFQASWDSWWPCSVMAQLSLSWSIGGLQIWRTLSTGSHSGWRELFFISTLTTLLKFWPTEGVCPHKPFSPLNSDLAYKIVKMVSKSFLIYRVHKFYPNLLNWGSSE